MAAGSRAVTMVPFLFGCAEAVALPGPILIELMVELGLGVPSAKSTLHRLHATGRLTIERHGRVGVYRLAGSMLRGFDAIRAGTAIHQGPPQWDWTFHTVVHDIPETSKSARERVRSAAISCGYGQLRPGLLICPYDRRAHLADIGDLPVDALLTWGRWAPPPDHARMIAGRAYDLSTIRDRYERTLRTLDEQPRLDGLTAADALRTLERLFVLGVQVRRVDPELPSELLPDGWPAGHLIARMDQIARTLGPPAFGYVRDRIGKSRYASHVERVAGR